MTSASRERVLILCTHNSSRSQMTDGLPRALATFRRIRDEIDARPGAGSTSFANPAVTFARAASDTFAGIRPGDVPGFVLAQLLGAAVATALFRWLVPPTP
jgi:hypothetical protein